MKIKVSHIQYECPQDDLPSTKTLIINDDFMQVLLDDMGDDLMMDEDIIDIIDDSLLDELDVNVDHFTTKLNDITLKV